jgi:hypothetical protein
MKKTALSFSLFGILGLFVAAGFWSSLRGEEDLRESNSRNSNAIVGSWDITIPGSPFRILRTYHEGGGVVDAYAFPPFTPTPGPLINSSGHGVWVRSGRQIKAYVKYFQLDPSQNAKFQVLDSIGSVTEVVTFDGRDHYTSTFTTKVVRPDGTPVLENIGTTDAKRIRIP